MIQYVQTSTGKNALAIHTFSFPTVTKVKSNSCESIGRNVRNLQFSLFAHTKRQRQDIEWDAAATAADAWCECHN